MTPRAGPALVELDGNWYVRTDVVAALHRKHALMHGRAFIVTDVVGDLPRHATGELGLYWRGTRHLSTLELKIGGARPLLLVSELSGDEREIEVEMTNGDLDTPRRLPRDVLHVVRRETLDDERLEVEVVISNHFSEAVTMPLSLELACDWKDMFEVRGRERPHRGRHLPVEVTPRGLVLRYEGLDGVQRWSEVALDPPPTAIAGEDSSGELRFELSLERGESVRLVLRVAPGHGAPVVPGPPAFPGRDSQARRAARRWREETVRFRSSDQRLERALSRAVTDLGLLVTPTEDGAFPLAGIPWYATPFGRDAIITALQLLPWRPDLAASVLRFLGKRRARKRDDFTDAEPGKIFHEWREGELATLREIPFVPYYGTVDATPLWLVLLGRYHSVTGDGDLVRELWDVAEDALGWIEGPGDLDGDGYLEYQCRSPIGLRNQGWKDSGDAVHHASGELAQGPIALVEVQAYAYAARQAFARLVERTRDERERAHALRARSEELRVRFEHDFWDEELSTYVIALDGAKRPCRIATSNGGHVLWMHAATPWRAQRIARRFFHPDLYSGHGVRTLAVGSRCYNPMSYHNGSVWPHDNAIFAEGLRRYGEPDRAAAILRALAEAAESFPLSRMPELFCGFPRRPERGPVPYPVACSPQAWASGALLQAVTATLGLSIECETGVISFDDPRLPEGVDWLEVNDIHLGTRGHLDVRVRRGKKFFAVEVMDKEGDVEVMIRKRGPVTDALG
jgi:glycogen debranching enzyme